MKEIIDFLLRLSENNNKVWFDEHRAEYLEHKARFEAFALDFMHGVEAFDPRVKNLGIKDITYRIYRDVRFSNDKSPYKNWFCVYVCPRGKKSGMAGYYIHIQPATDNYFICGGLYNPTKEVVASVRDEISYDAENFHKALQLCSDFTPSWDAALKKFPRGFKADDPHSEYYRLKSYEIMKPVTYEEVIASDFLQHALADLRRCYDYNELLNRCYDFVYGH